MLIPTKKNNIIVAGIDIGSNAIRMVIAEINDNQIINILSNYRKTTRLATGLGLNSSTILQNEHINLTLETLNDFYNYIKNNNIIFFRTVATAALRTATNSNYLISKAKDMGINIEVIDGKEEAELISLGVKSSFDLKNINSVIIDIGGGSTELIKTIDNQSTYESYRLGVINLAEKFNIINDTNQDIIGCQSYILDFIKNDIDLNIANINQLIITAGTGTILAQIDKNLSDYNSQELNGHILHLETIEKIFHDIISTPIAKRNKFHGLTETGADIIVPGCIILIAIMKKLNIETVQVSDYALRHGVAISAFHQNKIKG